MPAQNTATTYYFHCPQQSRLHLPLSRVNDGICDCCDGADELLVSIAVDPSSPNHNEGADTVTTTSPCPDICDMVLAEERAAQAKSKSDYLIGSQRRTESISQYQQWYTESQDKLRNLKEVELAASTQDESDVEQLLRESKLALARKWMTTVDEQVAMEPLLQIFHDEDTYDVSDLAVFIISLCALSAEITSDNVGKNGRCVAFDRASLDIGILWNYEDDDGMSSSNTNLPTFHRIVTTMEDSMIEYADQILTRLDGEHDAASKKYDKKLSKADLRRKSREIRTKPEDNIDDDYTINDIEGDWDGESHSEDGEGEEKFQEEREIDGIEQQNNDDLVKSLLEKVPIDRGLFKKQSRLLLDYQLDHSKDDDETTEGVDGANANDELNEDVDETPSGKNQVDPMALTMVKSTISKYLSQIIRGETSAASVARVVASIAQNSDYARRDLVNLAIMTMYHANVTSEDVAELIYSTSSILRLTQEGSIGESSCASPWSSMCPPRTVQTEGKSYPPTFLVEAALLKCDQRQNSAVEFCIVKDDEVEFPISVSDGYYNYFAPQSRGNEDALTSYFLTTTSLHVVPSELSELRKRKDAIDGQRASIMNRISDLESEIGDIKDGNSKYGVDGELFVLRGTCHKLEHGKYEYELCIFGQATQRDIGQKNGGTNLGSWDAESMEEGQRKLKWGGGTKCWNGPVRSVEVYVTCGAETKLLTADEPETCRYVLTMESPIGCDEHFKRKAILL